MVVAVNVEVRRVIGFYGRGRWHVAIGKFLELRLSSYRRLE